jgi:hypothetical protein
MRPGVQSLVGKGEWMWLAEMGGKTWGCHLDPSKTLGQRVSFGTFPLPDMSFILTVLEPIQGALLTPHRGSRCR